MSMMLTGCRTFFSLALVLTLLNAPAGRAQSPFKDKNLEDAVRAAIMETKALDDAALMRLFVLDAGGKKIKDLTGLEKCKNLAELKLASNEISDLSPLKDLAELQSLHLPGNKITDI